MRSFVKESSFQKYLFTEIIFKAETCAYSLFDYAANFINVFCLIL